MNRAASDLLLLITDTVLRVNAQGRWHGFIHFSGHTEQIDVYFLPADTDYQQPTEKWPKANNMSVFTAPHLHDSSAAVLDELRRLKDFAFSHLATDKEAA